MKKSLLALCAIVSCAFPSDAQISKGGLPQSVQSEVAYTNIPVSAYVNPDWDAHLQTEKESTNRSRPFTVGLYAAADFGFPQSGQLVHLANGQRIWRGQISITEAPSIALLYDKFYLPKGVKLFLSNESRQQVLGAFDIDNNDASGTFVTDAVQGSVVTVELDIEPWVSLDEIQLHIDRAAVLYRAIEHLRSYARTDIGLADQYDTLYNGKSSTCMINAICPQGSNYSNNRKATIQLILFNGQTPMSCSGTLVNNTSNSATNCKPYILTATHCEFSGSMSNTAFNQVITRFNFEHSACTGSPNPSSQSITGLDLLARSDGGYSTGDFMLLALRSAIPASYGAVLSGWNNNANIPTTVTEPKKFIGFHHPNGDNKKVSYGYTLSPYYNTQMHQLGWEITHAEGYVAGGSSGSGLFDGDGFLIGDLSSATATHPDSCVRNAAGQQVRSDNMSSYSSFSDAWDYSLDGPAANRKLKPWLDPGSTNAVTIGPASSSCTAIGSTSINTADDELSNSISIFPNPSKDGWVSVQYNLKTAQDMLIMVSDVTGKVVVESKKSRVQSDVTRLDISSLASGMYILKFASISGFTTKKLMIQK